MRQERVADNAIWNEEMKKRKSASRQHVVCIDNSDYPVSLDLHKIYEVLPDERATEDDCLRVIDESGEDYLYSSEGFVPIELPQKVIVSMNRRVRKGAKTAISKNQAQRKLGDQSGTRAGRG